MPFAANTILLKNIPLSYLDGRLLLNGTGLSFVNEGSTPSNVVFTTGDQTISGVKVFEGFAHFGNRLLIDSSGVYKIDWEAGIIRSNDEASSVDWEYRTLYGINGDGSLDWYNRHCLDANETISIDWDSRALVSGAETGLSWGQKTLYGVWSHTGVPTSSGHIVNKSYHDANSVYSMQFGHASLTPTDSTTYYFGAAFSDVPTSTQSTSPVMVVPTSGVLRKIVGNASMMTTLGNAETVSMIVYKNGVAAATGTYVATGYNNKIFSGLSSINLNVNALDTLQLGMSCPVWTVNPVGINNSLIAQISLG